MENTSTAYERHKERARQRSRENTREDQEIGPLPEVENPDRRAASLEKLSLFAKTYFPAIFYLPWADFHHEYTDALENVINHGGFQAIALLRGGGKTRLAEPAMIWGRCRGVVKLGALIGANQSASTRILRNLRHAFEKNRLLRADFPELCYPFTRLEGVNQRRLFLDGKPLTIGVAKDRIILPDAEGTSCTGGFLMSLPMTGGGIRGLNFTSDSGEALRPTHIIVDDPQTKKSAMSDKQCDDREEIIKNDIAGTAGPDVNLSIIMPCTVIRKGDLADRFLNRELNPDWDGIRHGLLKSLPNDLELWHRYWEVRKSGLIQGDRGKAGNEFYAAHREKMDAGAVSNWPERVKPNELSSIQGFMNVYLANPEGAMAELQNDPPDPNAGGDDELDVDRVAVRVTGYERGVVPPRVEYVSAGVDVQKSLLYWSVLGSEQVPTSYVLDYGAWPEQSLTHFHLRDAYKTIQRAFPKMALSAQLYAALEALEEQLFARTFRRTDGTEFRIGKLIVDARWETATIFKWAAQSPNRDKILPAQGMTRNQLNFDRDPPDGVKNGPTMDYRVMPSGQRSARSVQLISADWISRVVRMLQAPVGSVGALTLFNATPQHHRMIAEQFCSEYSKAWTDEKTGKRFVDWKLKTGEDNHLLDATKLALLGNYEQGLRESFDRILPANKPFCGMVELL